MDGAVLVPIAQPTIPRQRHTGKLSIKTANTLSDLKQSLPVTPPRELSPALQPRYLERENSPGERTFSTFSGSSGREEYRGQNFSTYHPNMRGEYFKRKEEYQRQDEYRSAEYTPQRPRDDYQPSRAPDHWERRSSVLDPSQRVFL